MSSVNTIESLDAQLALSSNLCLSLIEDISNSQNISSFKAFDSKKAQQQFKTLGTAISQKASQLVILCKPPSNDSDALSILDSSVALLEDMRRLFCSIPESRGKNLIDAYKRQVGLIFKHWSDMCLSLQTVNGALPQPSIANPPAFAHLLWSDVEAGVPVDNAKATECIWTNYIIMITDVIAEFGDLHKGTEDRDDRDLLLEEPNDTLSVDEKSLLTQVLALIKLLKLILLKIKKRCLDSFNTEPLSEASIAWLDLLVETATPLPSLWDDLGAGLYPPQQIEIITNQCRKLSNIAVELIDLAVQITPEQHVIWFEKSKEQISRLMSPLYDRVPQR